MKTLLQHTFAQPIYVDMAEIADEDVGEVSDQTRPLLNLDLIANAPVIHEPFTYLVARNVLSPEALQSLKNDFPEITKNGFLPVGLLKRKGSFDDLISEMEGVELAEILTEKLQIELRDKPQMTTIRKWSAAKDGRIHNDGESKIVTSILYLNDGWPEDEAGGRFSVLNSNQSFDDSADEISPVYGTFVAFVRSENSWHGHRPFVGERRVVQTTWLKSQEDLERKEKRGRFSFLLKNLIPHF